MNVRNHWRFDKIGTLQVIFGYVYKILKERGTGVMSGARCGSRPHGIVVRAQLGDETETDRLLDRTSLIYTSHPHQHSQLQHNSSQKRPTTTSYTTERNIFGFGESFARTFLNMHTLQKALSTGEVKEHAARGVVHVQADYRNMQH